MTPQPGTTSTPPPPNASHRAATGEHRVLHGTPDWSALHIEEDGESVADQLLRSFFEAMRVPAAKPEFLKAHRWRFANVEEPLAVGCLWDDQSIIGASGDWCQGRRVEGAFLSGLAMAERIVVRTEERKGPQS